MMATAAASSDPGSEGDLGNTRNPGRHFQLQAVAPGVYAAIHRPGGAAIGNAGIVDLGDRTLVYDTLFAPQAALELRSAGEAVGGRPVDLAINSHYHNDHSWGNQVFGPETVIVSTAETRRLLTTRGMEELRSFEEGAATELAALEAEMRAAGDEGERRRLSFWLDYYRAYVAAEPAVRPRLPDLTFTERLEIHGSRRAAVLIPFTGAHSGSDLVLWLPEERIAFMSDLLFVGCHPYLAEGDPGAMLRALAAVGDLGPRTLVPGHGPAGKPADLDRMARYVRDLDRLAGDLVRDGAGEKALDRVPVPEPFAGWDLDRFFWINLRAFFRRHLVRAAGDPG